jgi:hypothetical protein
VCSSDLNGLTADGFPTVAMLTAVQAKASGG